MTEKTRQEIFIEPGMSDGQRIILAGAGDEVVRTDVTLWSGNFSP